MPSITRPLVILVLMVWPAMPGVDFRESASYTPESGDPASLRVFRGDDNWPGREQGARHVARFARRSQPGSPEPVEADDRPERDEPRSDDPPIWIAVPFFGLFVGIGFYMLGIGLAVKIGFPMLFGSIFGGFPLLMAIGFGGRRVAIILGTLAAIALTAGFRAARRGSSSMARTFTSDQSWSRRPKRR
jgi:hypothetical protein